MECVLLIGIQASGKTTFYKEEFFSTHVRINLDMLKTRYKEDIYLAASFQAKQNFVVDNTNPTRNDRRKYIELSESQQCKVIGYFMEPDLESCLARNEARQGKARIPTVAIRNTLKKLETPDYEEGFDELYYVKIEDGQFIVSKMEK